MKSPNFWSGQICRKLSEFIAVAIRNCGEYFDHFSNLCGRAHFARAVDARPLSSGKFAAVYSVRPTVELRMRSNLC